jgi:hypothetical protein
MNRAVADDAHNAPPRPTKRRGGRGEGRRDGESIAAVAKEPSSFSVAVHPHPALRATFSRTREKGFRDRFTDFLDADAGRGGLLLPLAGEGWGEARSSSKKVP